MTEYYTLVGESKILNRPDIEFSTKLTELEDARKKAIMILNNPKYHNQFWGISLFKNGKYKGMVDKSKRGYRYLYRYTFIPINRNGEEKD